jgi:predicted site-specific integrase-resolvase
MSELDHKMESLNLMNAKEAAAYLGVELHWLQTHWKSEGIPTIRYSQRGRLLFKKSRLDDWVASREKVWVDPIQSERQKSGRLKVSLV